MNKFLVMTGVIVAIGTSHSNSWTGLYLGPNSGFLFNNAKLRSQQLAFTHPSETCNINSDYATYFPGIQLGYLHEFSNYFVAGMEANATVNTNQKNSLNCDCTNNFNVFDHFSFKNRLQSSIKGRAGRSIYLNKSIFLPYLTAGVSFVNVGLNYKNEGADYYSKNNTHAGWLIGTGIEWSLSLKWSVRAEYIYANYGNSIRLGLPTVYDLFDSNGNANTYLSTNSILFGVNYWI